MNADGSNQTRLTNNPSGDSDPAWQPVPFTCPAGKYNNGTSCVDADPGHYVPTAGATEQIPCAAGTYQPASGATSCIQASAGNFVAATGSVAQTPCPAGTYQPASGATSCLAADPGNFVSITGATQQTQCPVGMYQPISGQTSCLAAAPVTTYSPQVPSARLTVLLAATSHSAVRPVAFWLMQGIL